MKFTVRVECPKCKWGYKVKQKHLNIGFLEATCHHCGNCFFFKINILGVTTEVQQNLTGGEPSSKIEWEN